MKIRSGFVSNSSSSSYIVAVKKHVNTEPCPHCKRSTPDINLLEAISMACDNDSEVYERDGKEVLKYNEENFFNKLTEDQIKEIKKYDNANWIVAYIGISYHNELLKNIFDNMRSTGDVVVLVNRDT